MDSAPLSNMGGDIIGVSDIVSLSVLRGHCAASEVKVGCTVSCTPCGEKSAVIVGLDSALTYIFSRVRIRIILSLSICCSEISSSKLALSLWISISIRSWSFSMNCSRLFTCRSRMSYLVNDWTWHWSCSRASVWLFMPFRYDAISTGIAFTIVSPCLVLRFEMSAVFPW